MAHATYVTYLSKRKRGKEKEREREEEKERKIYTQSLKWTFRAQMRSTEAD